MTSSEASTVRRPGTRARPRTPDGRDALDADAALRLRSILELVDRNLARVERYVAYWRSLDELHPNRVGRLEDKVASEIALLVLLVRRLPPAARAALDPLTDSIAARLEPFVRNERFRDEIERQPALAAAFGSGHLYLTRAGYPDAAWDDVVLPAFHDGFTETTERPPYQILGRMWAAELAGLEAAETRRRDALSLSIVASRAHPLYMSQDDAYAYTHCLMYASDFGRRPVGGPVDPDAVAEVVRAALAWTLVEPDFDLLAEFVLCQTFLKPAWSEQAAVAWSTLCELADQLGFVPGPTFDEKTFAGLAGDERPAYAFKEIYHTNVVAGAVCCAVLAGGQSASGRAEARPPDDETALIARAFERCRKLRGLADSQVAPWEVVAGKREHRSALGRTLLEAALIHALRSGAFDEARGALDDLERSGSPAARTVTEARDYLANTDAQR